MNREAFINLLTILKRLVNDFDGQRGLTLLDVLERETGEDISVLIMNFEDWLNWEYEE